MGLIFDGSPVNLEAITAKVPTPTYSGKGNPGDPEADNPYTGDGPALPPGDPYWDDVVCLLQANNKAVNTQVVTEDSDLGKTVFNQSCLVALETSPVSDRAFQFNGVNQYMTIDHSADTVFASSQDYTIEFWIKNVGAGDRRACSIGDFKGNSGSLFTWNTDNAGVHLKPNVTDQTYWSLPATLTTGAWHHYALTNESNTHKAWINGALVGSMVSTQAGPPLQGTTSYVYFGAADHHATYNNGQRNPWNIIEGFMDDIRITKNVARYTAPFTPPTEPFLNFGF